jgi:hypothetical protein
MSDTDNIDNGLPPKLNLSRKTAKPIAKPSIKPVTQKPAPITGTPVAPPDTSRIKLTAKPVVKPVVKPAAVAKQKPVLTAKTTSAPATIRLQARPKTINNTTPSAASATTAEKGSSPTKTSALKPKTVKLNAKPAVGIKRDGIDPTAPIGSKRSTSKIPLSNVNSAAPLNINSVNTKTIKIKPSANINSDEKKEPLTINQDSNTKAPDPKRQTSRISLESALGADTEQNSAGPKTIRLKRPGKTPAIKVNKLDDNGKELSKTSKIEPLEDNSKIPATQKKTIKVKRPTQRRASKKISVKRPDDAEAEVATTDTGGGIPIAPLSSLAPLEAPDTVHWAFVAASIAATIIACVLIYALCAQVFGPNISLTQLSYGAPTVELPWPGRVY